MRTVIVDYNSGNLHSAEKSARRMAAEACAGDVILASEADIIAEADRIILPGVGAFADCRASLAAKGLDEAICHAVENRGIPFLGICVGMQLTAGFGLEHGCTKGFGWIPGKVVPIERFGNLKIPHMGWNSLRLIGTHPLFEGLGEGADVYFVHSYHLLPSQSGDCIAETDYGLPVTAAVASGNVAGTQFHPEKSQQAGLRILDNFFKWKPG